MLFVAARQLFELHQLRVVKLRHAELYVPNTRVQNITHSGPTPLQLQTGLAACNTLGIRKMCALLPTNVREGLDMLPTNVRERRVLRRGLAPLRHGQRREVRHVPRRPRQPVAAARDEPSPGREVDGDEPLLAPAKRSRRNLVQWKSGER